MTGSLSPLAAPSWADDRYGRRIARNFHATAIGPAARTWLREAGAARILHVTPRACNLISSDDEILSLVLPPVARGPFTLRVCADSQPGHFFTDWVRLGEPVQVSDHFLRVGEMAIRLDTAEVWPAVPDWEPVRLRLRLRLGAVSSTLTVLLRLAPADSLAPVVLSLDREGGDQARGLTGLAQRAARPLIQQMYTGLKFWLPPEIQTAAAGLGGLGPGLTPAGDDFLLGVLVGLWAIRGDTAAERLRSEIVSAAAPRTTPLSAAWLRAGARGEIDEVWHEFLANLASGESQAGIKAGLQILARGHTSGADALSGFMLALSANSHKRAG